MAQDLLTAQPQDKPNIWPDWQKQIVAVMLLLVIPVILYFLRPVMGVLLLTFFVTFVLMYPVRFLQRWLSYRGAALLIYFLFLLLSVAVVGWFIVYAIRGLFETLQNASNLIQQIFAVTTGDQEGGLRSLLSLDSTLDTMRTLSLVGSGVSFLSAPGEFVRDVISRISYFTSFVSGYSFMIILLLFFLLEWPRTLQIIGDRLPAASRREYALLFQRIASLGQNYILGSLLIVLFYWLVTSLLFAISGVPYPIVLGLIVAIPNFIPQGGGLVSAILVFIITLVTGSTAFATNRLIFAFVEMAIFMLISGIAYYFVDVKIYSKSVNVPVWVILVGIIVFSTYMGVIGAFIAAAAVAILGEILDFVLKKLQGRDPYPGQLAPAFLGPPLGDQVVEVNPPEVETRQTDEEQTG